jgi:hypothetical protein
MGDSYESSGGEERVVEEADSWDNSTSSESEDEYGSVIAS